MEALLNHKIKVMIYLTDEDINLEIMNGEEMNKGLFSKLLNLFGYVFICEKCQIFKYFKGDGMNRMTIEKLMKKIRETGVRVERVS